MSFFDETKYFGLIVAIVSVFGILVTLFMMIIGIDGVKISVLSGIGSILGDVLMLVFGYGVFQQEYLYRIDRYFEDASSNFGVLTGFVAVYGVTCILGGLFTVISGAWKTGAVTIIIGFAMLIMVYLMTDGKQGVEDKIIFVILLILFILMIIEGIMAILTVVGVVDIIIGIMLIIMLFSPEVRDELGM